LAGSEFARRTEVIFALVRFGEVLNMNSYKGIWGTLAGFGAGLGAMYFLDPDRGARRRAIAADKAASASRKLPRAVRVTKQDLSNRAHGFWAGTQHLFKSEIEPDDAVTAGAAKL